MCLVEIKLENRKEIIPFYSKWACIIKAKEYGSCCDVVSLTVTDAETGELYLIMENQRVTWYEGLAF